MSIIHEESSNYDDPRLTKVITDPNKLEVAGEPRLLPDRIGRYEVVQRLGTGGHCSVLLGHDPRLNRAVAIKTPRTDRKIDDAAWKELLHEARSVAQLRHESIISVIDVDRLEDGTPYVVMEFVDGTDLQTLWLKRSFDLHETLRLIRQIASGLQYVHDNGIIHRDLKPTNIIIDRFQNARIADFGLALEVNTSRDPQKKGSFGGTSRFMSPEQLSGESHRIDERTDVWGMGVILFWMCTGEYPFNGINFSDLNEQIRLQSHPSLHQNNLRIPVELDRICRRCLSDLINDRYPSAQAFIEDIDALQSKLAAEHKPIGASLDRLDTLTSSLISDGHQEEKPLPVHVIPKGLHAYDESDAGFFLELLPDPKDRLGVPEDIRFWLSRFSDSRHNISHGLIYGPSGCGKTSFVKAGLIPRLPAEIEVTYLECSPNQTESDLAQALSRQLNINGSSLTSLADLLREIREGDHLRRGKRLLIVLDQFEQYLSNLSALATSKLVIALRHCDGNRISCLLSVRDDFWTPTQEFLRLLEVKIQDGRNSQAFRLFEKKHAEKILLQFGQAFGTIPTAINGSESKPAEFAKLAIDALATNGKVNCAHLSILASVTSDRNWTIEELSRIGGWQGILVRFMNEQYSLETSPIAKHRLLPQIQAIVEELLPTPGSFIKSASKTRSQLFEACPNSTSNDNFENAICSLERECRFIKSISIGTDESTSDELRFQLCHDVLIEPLRTWVLQEKMQSWRGRSQIELSELSDTWNVRRSNQYFPSLPKLFRMKMATSRTANDKRQADFLSNAFRFQIARASVWVAAIAAICFSIGYMMIRSERARSENKALYARFLQCEPFEFNSYFEKLSEPSLNVSTLANEFSPTSKRGKIHNALAKHLLADSTQASAEELFNLMADAKLDDYVVAVGYLAPIAESSLVSPALEKLYENASTGLERVKYSAIALELGHSNLLLRIIGKSEIDPTDRTNFIHRFHEFSGLTSSEIAKKIVSEEEGEKVKSVLLTVLYLNQAGLSQVDLGIDEIGDSDALKDSGICVSKLTADERESVLAYVCSLYVNSKNGHQHSLAKFILQKENQELPTAPQLLDSDWHELKEGISLTKVAISTSNRESEVLYSEFMVSSSMITVGQFQQFLQDDQYSGRRLTKVARVEGQLWRAKAGEWKFSAQVSPTKDHPAVYVTPVIAAMYCNWLSEKHSLSKAYDVAENLRSFEAIPDSNGFRLPTATEVSLMRSGGWEFDLQLGSDIRDEWIMSYASFSECLPKRLLKRFEYETFPTGVNLPTKWGLLGIFGGVQEICVDSHKTGKPKTNYYGRSSGDRVTDLFHNAGLCKPLSFSRSTYLTGFRVAINKPPSSD